MNKTDKIKVNKAKLDKAQERRGETYTEFVDRGGELFPKDMYPIKKTSFGKIRYCRK